MHPEVAPDVASGAVPLDLVLALLSVDNATAASARHGDEATVAVLATYYAIVADAIAAADGNGAKVMGDGVLVSGRNTSGNRTSSFLVEGSVLVCSPP